MSEGGWAPFGPSSDDEPREAPVEPVEEPVPPPEPIQLPRREPEPEPEPDLPPAAFEPPAPPPLAPLPASDPAPLMWPDPGAPSTPPPQPPQQSVPPVGTWPPPGPPAYGTPPRIAGNATASLILGIVGLTFCPIIASIPAITLGYSAKREIRETPGLGGDGMASWGIGLGVVGLAFGALVLLLIVAGSLSV